MFLIMEEETELLPQSLRERREARERDFQGPEPDAFIEMDKIFSYFARGSAESLAYSTDMSKLDGAKHPNELRAIGGATYRAIQSEGLPLLDGLAANLLRRLFSGGSYYTDLAVKNLHSLLWDSAAKKYTALSVDELIRYINTPEYWKPVPLKGRKKEFEFSLRIGGSGRQKLVFTASFDDGDPWPTDDPQELIDVRIGGKFSAPELPGQLLDKDFREILADQRRRRKLADEFERAPRVRGIKWSIREAIAQELQKIGIRRNSYSREAFSSGRFPYPTTRTSVKKQKWDLVFGRCEHCGVVKELSVEPHDERMRYTDARYELQRVQNVCERLTERKLLPWHESFCSGQSPESVGIPLYRVEDL